MLNQSLQQKLQQKLSPQQIQMIKLLELPSLQLEQRVKKELEENPALEEGDEPEEIETQEETPEETDQDEFSLEDYLGEDDIPDYKLSTNNYSKDDERKEMPLSGGQTFIDYLDDQLLLKNVSAETYTLAKYLLGNLDNDGYLRRGIEDVVDDLAFSQNIIVESEQIESALNVVQSLDPAGVGARNLKECLLIQLSRKEKQTDEVRLAYKILDRFFESFTKKHYSKIISRLKISEDMLRDVLDIIVKLNPKPGASIGGNAVLQTIIPDFITNVVDGNVELSLTARNAPELHVNRTYTTMIETFNYQKNKTTKDREAILFVKQKLDSAKWFIDAIRQRQNTLRVTMEAIIQHQYSFFLEGDEQLLNPMILKDIADVTNLDISTISRVANSKYVQTPFGNYQLKYFFSESMQKEDGEEVSTRQIKTILMELIDEEDKQKPFTDEKLAEILKEKGFLIARRTVAKYREQLNIPVGRLRKEL